MLNTTSAKPAPAIVVHCEVSYLHIFVRHGREAQALLPVVCTCKVQRRRRLRSCLAGARGREETNCPRQSLPGNLSAMIYKQAVGDTAQNKTFLHILSTPKGATSCSVSRCIPLPEEGPSITGIRNFFVLRLTSTSPC